MELIVLCLSANNTGRLRKVDRVGNVGKPMDRAQMENVDSELPVLSVLANHRSTFRAYIFLMIGESLSMFFSSTLMTSNESGISYYLYDLAHV